MRRVLVLGTVWAAFLSSGAVQGQTPAWVDGLLPERTFDFGTVAKGSKVRHSFRLVNRLDQDVHIADTKTKCGCTEVRVGARTIPPGTQTTIEAVIDTTKFDGVKKSGLTLILDRPGLAQVDLNLNCFIRSEILLNPGVADFGPVTRASAEKPSLSMSLYYSGGQPNWGITRMQTGTAHVAVRLQEQSRSGGQVQYLLTATLDPKDLNGFFKDEVTLYTNEQNATPIPVSVSANVQSAVTVSPSPLVLGPIKAGQVLKRTVLVRSAQPFKLSGVKPSKDDLTATPDADGSRPVHTLTLEFKAPAQAGPYNAVVEIETDLKDEPPAKLTAFATIVP